MPFANYDNDVLTLIRNFDFTHSLSTLTKKNHTAHLSHLTIQKKKDCTKEFKLFYILYIDIHVKVITVQ